MKQSKAFILPTLKALLIQVEEEEERNERYNVEDSNVKDIC